MPDRPRVRHTEAEESAATGEGTRIWLVAAFATAVAVAALYFAAIQNVWIDETTQLSGATLNPGQLIHWLAGSNVSRFGVPGDRMPPVSYLIDSACDHSLCTTPFSFRLLHLAIVIVGLAVLLEFAAKRFGQAAAIVTGIVLTISPRLIETAIEIRAYPLFFSVTCMQLVSFCELLEARQWRFRQVAAFFILGLLAIYTHFFGVVSTMSLCVGLFASRIKCAREAAAVAGIGFALLLSSAGLIPFIHGAASVSGTDRAGLSLKQVLSWLPRVIAHPANLVEYTAAALLFVPLLISLGWTAGRSVAGARSGSASWIRNPEFGLLVALATGISGTLMASQIARGFDPLKPSYSGWMFPVIALLAGAGAAQWRNCWTMIATLSLFAGAATGEFTFLRNAEFFVHGPERSLAEAIDGRPAQKMIVYLGQNWAFGYFPVWFDYGRSVQQSVLLEDGKLHRLEAGGRIGTAAPTAEARQPNEIIVADIRLETFQRLRARSSELPSTITDARLDSLISASYPSMKRVAQYTKPGLYWTRISIFRNAA